jgi:YbbR domain-containing protein
MRRGFSLNRAVIDNLIWFSGSLALAFFVWMTATLQSDPIEQRRFLRLDVRMTAPPGLIISTPVVSNRLASVVVRAPRSVLDVLTNEEILVTADLSGMGSGDHTVDLQVSLARQPASVVDIIPRVQHVVMEEAAQRQVPLRAVVTSEPPAGYSRDEPVFDVKLNQALVSGAASKVAEVVAAQVELDLGQQRNPYEADLRLVAVDADGSAVAGVVLDPQVVHVLVSIRRRDDVREVSVRPNIQGTPPAGYVLSTLSYDPQAVLVSGAPGQLASLPDTLDTMPIDLSERIASFQVSVPVLLPDEKLLLLSAQNVTVSVEIKPVTGSRQFDTIPIEVLGLADGFGAHLAPNQVSVLVTGPQAQLDALKADEIRVALDLNGLVSGNYTLKPSVSVGQGQLPAISISVLPAEIDVEIGADSTPASSGR